MTALWQRLVVALKQLMAREPALVVKLVTWAVTWAITFASAEWFGWADDKQAVITGVVVAWVLGVIADWIATRQSVYSPATVDRLTYRTPRPGGPLNYELDPETGRYSSDPKSDAAWHPISAAEGEARVKSAFPDEHYTTGGDE